MKYNLIFFKYYLDKKIVVIYNTYSNMWGNFMAFERHVKGYIIAKQ